MVSNSRLAWLSRLAWPARVRLREGFQQQEEEEHEDTKDMRRTNFRGVLSLVRLLGLALCGSLSLGSLSQVDRYITTNR